MKKSSIKNNSNTLCAAGVYTHAHVVFERLKFFTAVAASVLFLNPSYSNIDSGANSADCDDATLGVSSGATNLEAQWQANTITLKWYDNDTLFTPLNNANAGTCTYDGALTVPSDTLSKTGYTFDGWTVRAAAPVQTPVQCSLLSDLDVIINGTAYAAKRHSGNDVSNKGATASTYGLTRPGEFGATFSYGTIKGEASCNDTTGTYYGQTTTKPYNEMSINDTGSKCWCRITHVNGVACPEESTFWYKGFDLGNYSCAANCSFLCADHMVASHIVRANAFGQSLFVEDCATITNENTCKKSFSYSITMSDYYVCKWSSYDSVCYNRFTVTENGCADIQDETICNLSEEDTDYSCEWNLDDEVCESYWDE